MVSAVWLGGASSGKLYAGTTPAWPAATTYPGAILATPGLVAYWRLGEASGLVQDSKGTNHATVFGGAPGYGAAGATTDGNKAITFDANDWFVVPDAPALDFGDWPFSIEFWLKRSVLGGVEVFLSKSNAFEVVLDGANNYFYLANGSSSAVNGPAITDLNWHHYAITRAGNAGSTCYVYQDGIDRTGTRGSSLFSSNAAPFTIGGRGTLRDIIVTMPGPDPSADPDPRVPSYKLNGTLDELALYNVALPAATVLAHYNAR